MLNYNKINNITGWVVFAIATIVYALTIEPTASFWDCGEFIATSYKLQVPHPPGAPFFLLVGRMFSFLAFGDETQVAFWVNMVSVISSSFTILFLFWSITLLGKKLLDIKEDPTKNQIFALMGAGVVGSLAYTFSDSFWFSATEAEVYAMSSFFTAFVFWAILKWEVIEDDSKANKWLILIAYMMGLSIGVHLLNLLTIPALALIYYFKKYKATKWGVISALIISGIIVLIILVGIIPGLPALASKIEIVFVNSFGLGFNSGIIFFVLVFIASLSYGVYYSFKNKKVILNTALLSLAFIVIGYLSYAIILIRAMENPPINQSQPDDVISMVSYLKREQYGSRSVLYGPYFTAPVKEYKKGAPIYRKGEDKYEIRDYKRDVVYDPAHMTILPRTGSDQPEHKRAYRRWMGLPQYNDANPPRDAEGRVISEPKPSFAENIGFMIRYQMGHMYWRYFMWNFAGRESDIQNAGWLLPQNAFDNDLPYELSHNKARNNFFMLPLLLGLIGLFFCFSKNRKSFFVLILLFLCTGMAIIIYTNPPPIEPRERDYAYVGSFYVFAMFIGFGVLALIEWLDKVVKKNLVTPILASAVSLVVPVIMAVEGWDDHDRSNRYFSVDSAKNFLNSCEKDAILFTGGDNDTYPLWYAQEVESIRTDMRVIVLSYFNTDWYISQMERKVYKSEAVPFTLKEDNYQDGGPNDYLPYISNPGIQGAINLKEFIRILKEQHGSDKPLLEISTLVNEYPFYKSQIPSSLLKNNYLPSNIFFVPIDREAVISMDNLIPSDLKDAVTDKMFIKLKPGRSAIMKNDLMLLDLIATNDWKRPIYFNHTSLSSINLDLSGYVYQEGNTYRLLPVKSEEADRSVNTEKMYENVTKKFQWRELNNPDVYYTEDYRGFVANLRSSFNTLAEALLDEGKRKKAKEIVLKSFEVMPDESVPYDYMTTQSVRVLLELEERQKAISTADILVARAQEWIAYATNDPIAYSDKLTYNLIVLRNLMVEFKNHNVEDKAKEYEEKFNGSLTLLRNVIQDFSEEGKEEEVNELVRIVSPHIRQ